MGKGTESIFAGESAIIPLAEVQFIEPDKRKNFEDGIHIILSGTTWNAEIDCYNNHAYLRGEEAIEFKKAWCRYRHELEIESLAKLNPGITMRFKDLPIGARFKYPDGDSIWVVVEPYGDGMVARWEGISAPRLRQSICSFVDDEYSLESEVQVIN
jgi:hypothetical protein